MEEDWSADYRLYSRDRLNDGKVFATIRKEIEQLAGEEDLVAAMDDSILRKTGRKIFGSGYRRDPMSPPFHVNFVRGLRVLQISAAVQQGSQGAARMVPIDFQHAALPAKPHRNAPREKHEAYALEKARRNINLVAKERVAGLRRQMDEDGSARRRLVLCIDGRFTNATVLAEVPDRTICIGRVRRDSAFYHPPLEQPALGRKRKYGPRCPTPEELLKDASAPWQTIEAFAAGQRHAFRIKTIGPVYSEMNKGRTPLRLIVIEPVAYRRTKNSKLERREPAYLICTDPGFSLEKVVQYYLWRWDIEVNFRDEKTILGVGHAQVRSEASNQNAPALAVAAYSFLLLGAIKAYGPEGRPTTLQQPRWHRKTTSQRPSTNDLINQLRFELWSHSLTQPNFQPFSPHNSPNDNGRKSEIPLQSALFYCIK